eukprot:TRINITY_DN486_c0_g1_i1.p1 TRINITY_DN486_c0_g1~~TRINITY_DN486_c0_g1_i1.p1  ORF type:complete len:175 (-),score=6.48 TRINITY_DN486_c0_g1_i1:99-623(-)
MPASIELTVKNETQNTLEKPDIFMQYGMLGGTEGVQANAPRGEATISCTGTGNHGVNGVVRYRIAGEPKAVIIAFDVKVGWLRRFGAGRNNFDVKAERVGDKDCPDLATIARLHWVDCGTERLWCNLGDAYNYNHQGLRLDTPLEFKIGHNLGVKEASMTHKEKCKLHITIVTI